MTTTLLLLAAIVAVCALPALLRCLADDYELGVLTVLESAAVTEAELILKGE